MFYCFDVPDVLCCQLQLVGAELFDGKLLELLDGDVCVLLEERDALAHALHAMLCELLLWRRDSREHVLHVGVEEHCAVYDANARHVVEGVARDLPAADEHIVVLRGGRLKSQFAEHPADHLHVLLESRLHFVGARDVAHHHVAFVGIYAAAAALAPVELYAVLAAIVDIDLVLDDLMPAEDDCRLHLPEEESPLPAPPFGECLVPIASPLWSTPPKGERGGGRYVFLHRQVEAQAAGFVRWQSQVCHCAYKDTKKKWKVASSRKKNKILYNV